MYEVGQKKTVTYYMKWKISIFYCWSTNWFDFKRNDRKREKNHKEGKKGRSFIWECECACKVICYESTEKKTYNQETKEDSFEEYCLD